MGRIGTGANCLVTRVTGRSLQRLHRFNRCDHEMVTQHQKSGTHLKDADTKGEHADGDEEKYDTCEEKVVSCALELCGSLRRVSAHREVREKDAEEKQQ